MFKKINFNDNVVFISKWSFLQNKNLCKNIRKYVINLLNTENLVCIGGEAYLIGLVSNITEITNYTNSKFIYDDCNFNNKFYRKIIVNELIDYNTIDRISDGKILLVNLARLNSNLMKIINKNTFTKIVIISCHHDDFWKKIKLLTNYSLIVRKKFITDVNFITVNIFIRKNLYISLGGNCAVSWNLRRLFLRKESYPFDWCKMNINKLNSVLENNFDGFSNVNIKKFSDNHNSCIYKNKYNITFAHEMVIYEKLEERIVRFKALKNPTFVILKTDNKCIDIDVLIKNLQRYFVDFKIIIISKIFISSMFVKYVKLDEFNDNWKYPNVNWRSIFSE